LKTQAISQSTFGPRQDTLLSWLGMAGILVNARGTILLVDPLIATMTVNDQVLCEGEYRLKVPLPVEASEVPRVDVVLYTHADSDHFGQVTARVLANQTSCCFVAPPPVLHLLEAIGVNPERMRTAREFETLPLGNVEVLVTPALHDWQEVDPWSRADCCGYLLRTPDGTIWHPGDTRLIEPLLEIRGVDVLMFDVAAVEAHLGPAGSARLAKSSGARVMVAYHYGTFDLPPGSFGNCLPEDSLPYLEGVPAEFLQLDPGELLRLPL
jgi:L-ascorbate metabolism protein UlaG (beta-lactamase superfamily)